MESFADDSVLIGRDDEVRSLQDAVRQVSQGRGGSVWIDGEPGIGKSALLAAGLADAEELGCQVFRGTADEFAQRYPLRVMLDCLGVAANSPDPDRRAISEMLSGACPDPSAVVSERLLALVDRMCTTSPVILMIDDIQWADEADLQVWHRLGRMIGHLPLLLIAAAGPAPRRPELACLRRGQIATHASVIVLDPLSAAATAELAGHLLDTAAVGPALRQFLERAAGNPRYVREIVDALNRDGHLTRSADDVELTSEWSTLPEPVAALIAARLRLLGETTWEVLRVAALLGPAFSVTDLSTVSGRPVVELVGVVEEALACGILLESGARLEFRHGVVRQALYEGIPHALRLALHNQAARALDATGARIEYIAEHLLAALPGEAALSIDDRIVDWLVRNARKLADRAPEIAVDLLTSCSAALDPDDARLEPLRLTLASVLLLLGRPEQAQELTERLLAETQDPATAAETSWHLAWSLTTRNRHDQARTVLENAIGAPELGSRWTARLQGLLATIRFRLGHVEPAAATAGQALEAGRPGGDRLAIGLALHVRGMVSAGRYDLAEAAADFDRALTELGNEPEYGGLRLQILADQRPVLLELGKVDEAEQAVREMLVVAERSAAAPRLGAARLAVAEHFHATGRWNDAVAELEAAMQVYDRMATTHQARLRELIAIIANHRGDRAAPGAQLSPGNLADGTDFALLAQAMQSERNGHPEDAVACLRTALASGAHPGTRHTWLPRLVRLALAADDRDTAVRATDACEADAARGSAPGVEAAAQHCRGLLKGDPLLIETAYRRVDQPPRHAQALEDAAVLFARRGDLGAARAAYVEATRIYTDLGANWDLLRADARLRPHGMRRLRARSRTTATGWDALTPTELEVARLVADGHANADIAAMLFSSKRTIEVHVSRILAKLGVRSRVEIAIEATRHPRSGQSGPLPQKDRYCG